ncbi:MAG TPA: hypothetical protein VK675_03760 [Candidatus Paceibacterota bacterium]|nr:hypothetical protein [Candidatus Paceibacterota bacterium]
MKQETKNCQNCKKDFTIEPDDFGFYEKIKVLAPTFCPECRLIRRMTWRNERSLYSRSCDMCHKSTIGTYPADSPFTVYCHECWWGDGWDGASFSKEYDFSKSFFEQFKELMNKIPRIAMTGSQNINSDYANYSISNKNAYLCFASHYNEDGAYLQYSNKTKNAYDCLHVNNAEFIVDCNYCTHLYRCAHLTYADSCSDTILGYDLRGCNYCFGCVGLRQMSYHIFNVQYSKEEYKKKVTELTESREAFQQAKQQFEILKNSFPRVFAYQRKCVDCTGNDIEEGKYLHYAFSVRNSENSKYMSVNCVNVKDSMDVNNIAYDPSELCYEVQGVTNSNNIRFLDASWNNSFVEYTNLCFSSEYLFGCVGLKKKEYHILNKKYSKEEYKKMLEKIKIQMNQIKYFDSKGSSYGYGEFFPAELSPFSYNETIAMTYYPIKKEEAAAKSYKWRKDMKRNYKVTLQVHNLPSNPEQFKGSITNEIINCVHEGKCDDGCTSAFRILLNEVQVYKSLGIQLPTMCPNCRNMERIKMRGPFKLYLRSCMCDKKHPHHQEKCSNEFETTYAPDRPEMIYCERCYQQEVY